MTLVAMALSANEFTSLENEIMHLLQMAPYRESERGAKKGKNMFVTWRKSTLLTGIYKKKKHDEAKYPYLTIYRGGQKYLPNVLFFQLTRIVN